MAEETLDDRAVRGSGLLNLTFLGTAAIVVTSTAAALVPGTFARLHAVVSCVLFAIGTGALLWAYALGVSRSRAELVNIGGLFFLAGSVAPASTQRAFRVALSIEVVAVLVAASVRPYTEVAFGVLAPVFSLGLMGMWAGRYGVFPARPPKGQRRG